MEICHDTTMPCPLMHTKREKKKKKQLYMGSLDTLAILGINAEISELESMNMGTARQNQKRKEKKKKKRKRNQYQRIIPYTQPRVYLQNILHLVTWKRVGWRIQDEPPCY